MKHEFQDSTRGLVDARHVVGDMHGIRGAGFESVGDHVRKVGGIPMQVIDGETGFTVTDVEGCARASLFLLQHPNRAREMGERAREHVRKNFLSTRHLMDYLKMFGELAGQPQENASATTQSGD